MDLQGAGPPVEGVRVSPLWGITPRRRRLVLFDRHAQERPAPTSLPTHQASMPPQPAISRFSRPESARFDRVTDALTSPTPKSPMAVRAADQASPTPVSSPKRKGRTEA